MGISVIRSLIHFSAARFTIFYKLRTERYPVPDFNIDELTAALGMSTERAKKKLGTINILIAGLAGAGKSTLINAVFGEGVAEVGVGFSKTQEIQGYKVPNTPLTLYDTPGFEIRRSEQTIAAVNDCIRQKRTSSDHNEQIHIAWTCLLEQSHRIEPVHKTLLSLIRAYEMPSIVVITQALGDSEMEQKVRQLAVPRDEVVALLAVQKAIGGTLLPSYGVGDLIDSTYRLLPEAHRSAFIAAQRVRWDLKEAAVKKVINANAALGAGSALIPLPGGHSAALIVLQLTMIAEINQLIGLSLTDMATKELAAAIGGIMVAKVGGQQAFALGLSEALKFVPGLNFIGMALIGGPIGGAMTKAFGHVYYNTVVVYAKREQPLPSVDELMKQMSENFQANRNDYEAIVERPE
jgi:uncharacterized protein (DUF697 family)/GTP-binding protein EngB required for normal cell division